MDTTILKIIKKLNKKKNNYKDILLISNLEIISLVKIEYNIIINISHIRLIKPIKNNQKRPLIFFFTDNDDDDNQMK